MAALRDIIGALRLAALTTIGTVLARWIFLQFRRVTLLPTPYTTPPIGPAEVEPRMRRVVVSDLHLGGGDHLDDFDADDALVHFIDHYVAGNEPTELILAGDTLELLQVRLADVPDEEWSQWAAVCRVEAVIIAHRNVFDALARFVELPGNQLTLLIGNHDFELHYPAAKAVVATALDLSTDDPRLRFGLTYHGDGIYIVHGNQWDKWNRFIHFEGITEPFEVVRGTQLVKEVINDLEDDPIEIAQLIDNVKPTSAFFWYMVAVPRLRNATARRFLVRGVLGFIQVVLWPTPQHMPVTGEGPGGWLGMRPFRLLWNVIGRIRRGRVERHRQIARQVSEVAGELAPPPEVIEQVQDEATRQLGREMRDFNAAVVRAMRALADKPELASARLFICGHTHHAQMVPFDNGRTYFNTGTWTEIVYDVATMLRQEQRYPFLEIRYDDEGTAQGQLLVWKDSELPPDLWHDIPLPRRRQRLLR